MHWPPFGLLRPYFEQVLKPIWGPKRPRLRNGPGQFTIALTYTCTKLTSPYRPDQRAIANTWYNCVDHPTANINKFDTPKAACAALYTSLRKREWSKPQPQHSILYTRVLKITLQLKKVSGVPSCKPQSCHVGTTYRSAPVGSITFIHFSSRFFQKLCPVIFTFYFLYFCLFNYSLSLSLSPEIKSRPRNQLFVSVCCRLARCLCI